MKKLLALLLIILAALLSSCGTIEKASEKTPDNIVTILYTNDTHTYINNIEKDDNGTEKQGLNFAKLAGLKKDLIKSGENVLLVDAGDHVQGSVYGAFDEGRSIIDMMNAAGYDLATLGNHEFDYGMFRTFSIMAKADFPYVSCNFYEIERDRTVLPESKTFTFGDKKVAFIGICTPASLTSSAPAYFQDEKGNYIYSFYGEGNPQILYDRVQSCIDALRKDGVDYIIALGHVGNEANYPITSTEIIKHTNGLDAFIDGHTHTVLEDEFVKDLSGKDVPLTRTGCWFGAIGKMTIAKDGKIKTELIKEYDNIDETTDVIEKTWIKKVDEIFAEKIATANSKLWIYDAENPEAELARWGETNLGDVIADAMYWYFNEHEQQDCDAAIVMGGAIRANIEAGDITYKICKTCQPYGNYLCLVTVKGQDIIDALEWSARDVGRTDENNNPVKNGGFGQMAGVKFKIDKSIESSVVSNNNIWESGPTGAYKVSDVQVYNREKQEYENLDPNADYNIAGVDYALLNCGNGYGMFKNAQPVCTYVIEDYMSLIEYFKAFKENADGFPGISTENSPISGYTNYLIDYENPKGSGRIIETD